MPSKHFINPVMSTSLDMIKYQFIYGLSDDVTEEFLGKKRNTYVQYKSYISEIKVPMVESPYLRKCKKGSKGNRYADKLAYYWDNSNWGNQIYTLYGTEYEKNTQDEKLIGEEMAKLFQGKDGVKLSREEEKLLRRFGILTNGKDGRVRFRTPGKWEKKEQSAMAELICFFSHFVPIPALGYSVLQRWGKEDVEIPAIIRGQSLFEPLRQENIYRCLLALANGYQIQYCGVWMRPINFDFRDNFLYEKNRNAYVELMDSKGKTVWCQVPEKPLLCLKDSEEIEERGSLPNIRGFEDTYVIYEVEMLMNQDIDTDFLKRKARRIWTPLKEEDTKNQITHIQTYNKAYPNWSICVFTYQIPEREEEEFQRFIKSFGDYVYQSRRLYFGEEKKDMKGLYSLCTPYNSRRFLHRWKKNERQDILPLTNMEMYWLEFVLLKYENFSRMFLGDVFYKRSLEKIEEEIKNLEAEFSGDKVYKNIFWKNKDTRESYFDKRIKDLPGWMVKNCRELYLSMADQRCFQSAKGIVYPYGFEFHVAEYMEDDQGFRGFKVMAYQLEQKRSIVLFPEKFFMDQEENAERYQFPTMEEIAEEKLIKRKKQAVCRLKKNASRKRLDRITEYCRNFNCRFRREGDDIFCELEYEAYDYRKLHEILLALQDDLVAVKPEELVQTLCERTAKLNNVSFEITQGEDAALSEAICKCFRYKCLKKQGNQLVFEYPRQELGRVLEIYGILKAMECPIENCELNEILDSFTKMRGNPPDFKFCFSGDILTAWENRNQMKAVLIKEGIKEGKIETTEWNEIFYLKVSCVCDSEEAEDKKKEMEWKNWKKYLKIFGKIFRENEWCKMVEPSRVAYVFKNMTNIKK